VQERVNVYLLVLGVLGVWRVTHLLHAEDGPGDVIVRLRRRVGHGILGQAMDCFKCLSLWVAAPFALLLGDDLVERGLLWPALSAAAIVVEGAVRRLMPAEATWAEDVELEKGHLEKSQPETSDLETNDLERNDLEKNDVQLWKSEARYGNDNNDTVHRQSHA
jgi:hypothetical protein